MALTSREIRTKCDEISEKMSALINKPGIMSEQDAKEFDKLDREFHGLISEKKKLEVLREVREFTPIQSRWTAEERMKAEKIALSVYLKHGQLPIELRDLMTPSIRLAQQTTTGSSGGYTIPQGFINDLEVAMKDFGGMWESARIVKTERGNTTSWGTTNDSGNKAYIINESEDVTTDAEAVVFGAKTFQGVKYTSGLIQVPNELLEDSELFANDFLGLLSERFYRGSNEHLTTGDGNNKPKGVTASAILGRNTEADGAISSDDILHLIHSVDPAYRKRARFMMHDTTALSIEKLATSTTENRPLWFPPVRAGEPATLFGYPITINQDMASFVGAETSADDNKKIMLFGDFKKYIIRQARDMRIVRLPTRYADLDQTAFVVFMRIDGDIINAGTDPIKYMRVSAT